MSSLKPSRSNAPSRDVAARSRRAWLALGARRHASALALLAAVALALHHRAVLHPGPQGDEPLYAAAAARVTAGASPFEVPGYYYPAAFAHAWAVTERLAPSVPAWRWWRGANLAAAVLLVWLAAGHLSVRRERWWLAPLLGAPLLAAPGLSFALGDGNLSPLTALLVAAGVLSAGRRWAIAGLLLGLSVAIKPFALPALVALAVPWRRPGAGEEPSRRLGPTQRAGLLGLALAAAVLLAFPHWRELLGQPVQALTAGRTVSVDRLFHLLGLELQRPALLALVYGALAAAAWRFTRTPTERAVVALAGAVVAAPLVWSHTMLLALPMLTLALSLHWPLLARPRVEDTRRAAQARRDRLVAVAAGALVALQLLVQPGGFDHLSRLVQIALALPMLAAPPLTAALVIRRLRAEKCAIGHGSSVGSIRREARA
jgi:hypothetical protein